MGLLDKANDVFKDAYEVLSGTAVVEYDTDGSACITGEQC